MKNFPYLCLRTKGKLSLSFCERHEGEKQFPVPFCCTPWRMGSKKDLVFQTAE